MLGVHLDETEPALFERARKMGMVVEPLLVNDSNTWAYPVDGLDYTFKQAPIVPGSLHLFDIDPSGRVMQAAMELQSRAEPNGFQFVPAGNHISGAFVGSKGVLSRFRFQIWPGYQHKIVAIYKPEKSAMTAPTIYTTRQKPEITQERLMELITLSFPHRCNSNQCTVCEQVVIMEKLIEFLAKDEMIQQFLERDKADRLKRRQ